MSRSAPVQDDLLRLRDAAKRAGVTVQQLQYYLMVGVVRAPGRSSGDQRLFDAQTIQRIRMVRLLNASGYTLRDIREIFMESRKPGRKRRGGATAPRKSAKAKGKSA